MSGYRVPVCAQGGEFLGWQYFLQCTLTRPKGEGGMILGVEAKDYRRALMIV